MNARHHGSHLDHRHPRLQQRQPHLRILGRGFAWAAVGAFASFGLLTGCDDDLDGCRIVCERNDECSPASPGFDSCFDQCEQLAADDPDFAEAIDDQAECYEESTCEQIEGGACIPSLQSGL